MRKQIVKLLHNAFNLLPERNIILFESSPDYSDNTKAVFDEMIRRNLNKKYKLIWVIDKNIEQFKDIQIHNVCFISRSSRIFTYYYNSVAKCIISCNYFLEKKRKKQHYYFLEHGAAVKNTKGKYSLPKCCLDADILTLSSYLIPYQAENYSCSKKIFKVTGYPRNDTLFGMPLDLHKYFVKNTFSKVIYWMPTYRQHKSADISHSNISLPIIYTKEIAEKINAAARKNNILIVLKPHPAQDVSLIKKMNLSHLVFIDDAFFNKNNISNYELLKSSDALLTDYSSVYYDYLLTDKPIGLCWDDYKEYEKREGFAVDMDTVMAGGEKLYNADDLCSFIDRLARGEDRLQQERLAVKGMIHNYTDNESSERVVDFIERSLFE